MDHFLFFLLMTIGFIIAQINLVAIYLSWTLQIPCFMALSHSYWSWVVEVRWESWEMFALCMECLLHPELLPSPDNLKGVLTSSEAMPIGPHSLAHFTFCFSFVPSFETSSCVGPVSGCANVQAQNHHVCMCVCVQDVSLWRSLMKGLGAKPLWEWTPILIALIHISASLGRRAQEETVTRSKLVVQLSISVSDCCGCPGFFQYFV